LTPILVDRLPALDEVPAASDDGPSPEPFAALDAFNATVEGYRPPDVDVIEAVAPGPRTSSMVTEQRPGSVVGVSMRTTTTPRRRSAWSRSPTPGSELPVAGAGGPLGRVSSIFQPPLP
jgi:hypothetical protein